jgi:glycosyltransferase involved in cell wall biosynthesis
MKTRRIAIVSTHPIQYNAPFFRLLSKQPGVVLRVFYTWQQAQSAIYDPTFGHVREWDIPLLEGYDYCFLKNTAKKPGSHHFWGMVNPDAIATIEQWQPDVVCVYGWSFWSHLQIMRHFKGRKQVWFRGDSTTLDWQPGWKQRIRKAIHRLVYRYVDVALYAGTHNKTYFQNAGLKETQLLHLPHAIDNQRFGEDRKREAQQLRAQLQLSHDDILVLFAGKFSSKKDPLRLLEAVKKIQQPTIQVLFCGNGPLEIALKSAAQGMKQVHFLDFQNQTRMPVLYQACDVYCLPSAGPGETWGLALNEAMAAGKAVIATDKCGGAIDLIQQGINGWRIPAQDTEALAATLQQLVQPVVNLTGMGLAGKQAITEWSYQKGINNMVKPLMQ